MHEKILSTSTRGLRTDIFPYRLYQKAKRFGVWNPEDIDFSQDIKDWETLTPYAKQKTLQLISIFLAAEEAVTIDLLPLMMTVAKEGRIEEEMYLTTFLFEEAKHTEFFRLFLNKVGVRDDLSHFHPESYRKLFFEILPTRMDRLLHDTSPKAVADASLTYNMVVEGVGAETGYTLFYKMLFNSGVLPGLMKGIENLKRDESRHIAYGTFLLQRIIAEDPTMFDYIQSRIYELMPYMQGITEAILGDSDPNDSSYVEPEEIKVFSEKQFSIRIEKLERAKYKTIEEIYKTKEEAMGV